MFIIKRIIFFLLVNISLSTLEKYCDTATLISSTPIKFSSLDFSSSQGFAIGKSDNVYKQFKAQLNETGIFVNQIDINLISEQLSVLASSRQGECILLKIGQTDTNAQIGPYNISQGSFNIIATSTITVPKIVFNYYIGGACDIILTVTPLTNGDSQINVYSDGISKSFKTYQSISGSIGTFNPDLIKFDQNLKYFVNLQDKRIWKLDTNFAYQNISDKLNNSIFNIATSQVQILNINNIDHIIIHTQNNTNEKLLILPVNNPIVTQNINQYQFKMISSIPQKTKLAIQTNNKYILMYNSQNILLINLTSSSFRQILVNIHNKTTMLNSQFIVIDDQLIYALEKQIITYMDINSVSNMDQLPQDTIFPQHSHQLYVDLDNNLNLGFYAQQITQTKCECKLPCAENQCDETGILCIQCIIGYVQTANNNGTCTACTIQKCNRCAIAEISQTCLQCDQNLLKYDQSRKCGPCPDTPHCISCNEELCSECETLFKLSENSTCICDIVHCVQCREQFCNRCQQGYKPSTLQSQCICNVNSCKTCNQNLCAECQPSYTLSQDSLVCVPLCLIGICGQQQFATYNGVFEYFQSQSTIKQLGVCPPNCYSCLNTTRCTICNQGYSLQTNFFSCESCSEKCKKCGISPSDCTQCFVGFQLIGSSCISCSTNCELCSSGQCTKCYHGYGIINGACQACTSDLCLVCNNNLNVCSYTRPGYTVTSNGDITQCTTDCSRCNGDALQTCEACDQGYYLTQESVCALCLENCTKCTSATTCQGCKYGFTLNLDFICIPDCQYPCYYCLQGQPTKCTLCYGSHTFDDATNSCNQKPPCQNETTCICKRGSQILLGNDQNSCIECQITDSNCQRCNASDPTVCLQCNIGYFHTVSGCNACPVNCLTCKSEILCKDCADGYYKVTNETYGQCRKCGEFCETCSLSKDFCLKCLYNDQIKLVKDGWRCISQQNLGFQARIDILFSDFSGFSNKFKQLIVDGIGQPFAGKPERISIKTITEGSCKVTGNLTKLTTQTIDQSIYGLLLIVFTQTDFDYNILQYKVARNGDLVVPQQPGQMLPIIISVAFFVVLTIILAFSFAIAMRIRRKSQLQQYRKQSLNRLKDELQHDKLPNIPVKNQSIDYKHSVISF